MKFSQILLIPLCLSIFGPLSVFSKGPKISCSPPKVKVKIKAKKLREISGISVSQKSPSTIWAHNDSGDGPFFYSLNLKTKKIGKFRILEAENNDFEDMTDGPCEDKRKSCLYIGDIGDNELNRKVINILAVEEPQPTKSKFNETKLLKNYTYSLPRPYNSEALIFHPKNKAFYIFTKNHRNSWIKYPEEVGQSLIFELPLNGNKAREVGRLKFSDYRKITKKSLKNPKKTFITGATLSPDLKRVTLITSGNAYEFSLAESGNPFQNINHTQPKKIRLPRYKGVQIESVTYSNNGKDLFVISEALSKKEKRIDLYFIDCSTPTESGFWGLVKRFFGKIFN